MSTIFLVFLLLVVFVVYNTFIIVEMREEVILERLGKYHETLKPGFHFVVPFIDRVAYRQEMREQVIDVPHQKCITKDNIEVDVDGLVYLKVMDAYKASYGREGDALRDQRHPALAGHRADDGEADGGRA